MPPTVFEPPRVFNRGAHYFKQSGQTIAGNSTFQTLDMDTVVADTDGFWSAGAPSRLTVPSGAGGNYFIWGGPQVENPGQKIEGRMLINGSVVGIEPTTDGFIGIWTTLKYGGPLLFHLASLSAGDYIETQGWNDNGGTRNARTQIGLVELPFDEACLLKAVTPIAATTTYTVLPYETALYDPTGMRNGNKIEIDVDGWYMMFSSVTTGGLRSFIAKNGSGVPINGSFAMSPSAFGFQDFCVDYLVAGDYIEHLSQGDPAGPPSPSNPIGAREFMAFRFGDDGPATNFAYAYPAVDTYNTGTFPNGFDAAMQCGAEFYDTGGGSPYQGRNWDVGLLEGLHLCIGKLDSQGSLASNQAIQARINEVDLVNAWTSNRNGAYNTTQIAIALFETDDCDYLTFRLALNDTNVRFYYAVTTNCFATDVMACIQQIYRRLEVDPTP